MKFAMHSRGFVSAGIAGTDTLGVPHRVELLEQVKAERALRGQKLQQIKAATRIQCAFRLSTFPALKLSSKSHDLCF